MTNYKKFASYEIKLNERFNILIGDNEAGKSTILSAVDLVLSGSRNKLDTLGLENVFNKQAIRDFMNSGKEYEKLPIMQIQLFISEIDDPYFNGENNSEHRSCDGIRMRCIPDEALSMEIKDIIEQPGDDFPFEYYTVIFETYAGSYYSGAKKPLRWVIIDTAANNNEYATREYIKNMYESILEGHEKASHSFEYRKAKDKYSLEALHGINDRIEYKFGIKNSSKANLETDLTVIEDGVSIENKGKGRQCFVKASFALAKHKKGQDIILIEEPENHLSHVNMKKLIRNIELSEQKQLVITTHNPLICSRLDLRNVHIIEASLAKPVSLNDISEGSAKYFMKAPDSNILEFILSHSVILVEGDAEYILFEEFYKTIKLAYPETEDVHIISVNGTGFKNYIELAKKLDKRVAIIRDNDGNYETNCVNNYTDYCDTNIKIFADTNNDRYTLEVCIFKDNQEICNELFSKNRRTLSVLEYMTNNKTETAFELLTKKSKSLVIPEYIREAIQWIS